MTTVAYGDAPGHEIPYRYAAIIASHRQIVSTTVECAGESLTTRVQVAVVVLQNVLTWPTDCKNFYTYFWIILTEGFYYEIECTIFIHGKQDEHSWNTYVKVPNSFSVVPKFKQIRL